MASLALAAALVFLFVVLIGPATLLLSKSRFIPRWIILILGTICILSGIWFFLLPINIVRFFGLLTAYLGWLAMKPKETSVDNR